MIDYCQVMTWRSNHVQQCRRKAVFNAVTNQDLWAWFKTDQRATLDGMLAAGSLVKVCSSHFSFLPLQHERLVK
jgi:hypothetical protein